MSDIAENLLAQYYGLSKKSETEKFLSIHECVSNVENNAEKLIGEQSTVDTDDNDTSRETEVQVRSLIQFDLKIYKSINNKLIISSYYVCRETTLRATKEIPKLTFQQDPREH